MEDKDKLIRELQQQVHVLQTEVSKTQTEVPEIQDTNHTEAFQASRILPETITKNHARFFYSMFKDRRDVYSKRAGKPGEIAQELLEIDYGCTEGTGCIQKEGKICTETEP